MFRFVMKETDEYERLREFMESFGLEFNTDDEEIVKCWKVVQDPDYLVGGCILSRRKGEYVIGGIAVDTPMRNTGIGRIMMKKAIGCVKKMGGSCVWLTAKVPDFYKKLGFYTVDQSDAPDIFGCGHCSQRGVNCFPEVMKYEISE